MKNKLAIMIVISALFGCDRVATDKIATEVLQIKNQWSISEKVDKISNAKTLIATAVLTDDSLPKKSVDTEIVCEDGKNAHIQFILRTKDDATKSQSEITLNKDVALLRMRSGSSKFDRLAGGGDFSNQVIVPFAELGGYAGIGAGMMGASTKPLDKELTSPELYVEIPSIYGSPVVLIKLNEPNIQSVLKNCGIIPAYQNQSK